MTADATDAAVASLNDVLPRLGVGFVPHLLGAVAEADVEFWSAAWEATGTWLDSEFFEEAAVVAGAALEEVADAMPPAVDHVRLGAFAGSDLPVADAAVEALFQTAARELILAVAWHRAVTEQGFGSAVRSTADPLSPGPARFMRDLPRPPDDAAELAAAAAAVIGLAAAASRLQVLTRWPDYLTVVAADFSTRVGSDELTAAVERVGGIAHEVVSSLAAPMPALFGAAGKGATLVAEAAGALPEMVVLAAFLRLGMPHVARIPRVA